MKTEEEIRALIELYDERRRDAAFLYACAVEDCNTEEAAHRYTQFVAYGHCVKLLYQVKS